MSQVLFLVPYVMEKFHVQPTTDNGTKTTLITSAVQSLDIILGRYCCLNETLRYHYLEELNRTIKEMFRL